MNSKAQSKIMWTSGLTAVLGMASFYGYIPEKIETNLNLFMTTAVPALIFYFRGWQTGNK